MNLRIFLPCFHGPRTLHLGHKAMPIYFLVSRNFFKKKWTERPKKNKKIKIVLANKRIYNTLLTKKILQNNI